jgi:hypothetical protein
MEADHEDAQGAGSSPNEGRFLIEIESWDGNLHVGLAPRSTPAEQRFQRGLAFVQGFEIVGRVVAPKASFARAIRVWLSPFGPEVQFGDGGLDEVGQFRTHPQERREQAFTATLLVPEAALPLAATCLGSVWKYLHIWTFDEEDIAYIEGELTAPIKSLAGSFEASEIRAHVKAMTVGERQTFIQKHIDAGDAEVVSAVLGAKSFLTGLDANMQAVLLRHWHMQQNPAKSKRLKALQAAKEWIERDAGKVFGELEKAVGGTSSKAKKVRDAQAAADKALSF